MGARRLKKRSQSFEELAQPVPENWADRHFLLSVPQVMTITSKSYSALLGLIKAGLLKPAGDSKPFMFAPNEVLRVFFSVQEAPKQTPRVSPLRSLKTESKSKAVGHTTKPKKEVLWHR